MSIIPLSEEHLIGCNSITLSKAYFIGYKPIIVLSEVHLIGYKPIIALFEVYLIGYNSINTYTVKIIIL
jgi:hypothetical protein